MASHLSFKLKREYSMMCSFVKASMTVDVVQSNFLLLWGDHNKESRFRHNPELLDVAVMALLVPWRG